MKLGEIVSAKITEVVNQNEMIVSFDGDLLRVVNQTGQPMRVGQFVRVQVMAVRPLQFRLVAENRGFNRYA